MNNIIIAPAGSGKTTKIVNKVFNETSRKVLIVTYTLINISEIKRKFYQEYGYIPSNVTITPWFTFLLRDFVRPYQNFVYTGKRIESITFVNGRSAKGIPKVNVASYYLNAGKNIYTDKISEFGCVCNERSKGLVIKRLANIYDHIYIDEAQDLAGYDLELVELLFRSKIDITLVGDHRQATYKTNQSPKNKKYSGTEIINKFNQWEKQKLCTIEYWRDCFRCNQDICAFADKIYPKFPNTISKNYHLTGHDGVFIVSRSNISDYIRKYSPQILRYDKLTDCLNNQALNFGESKGLTFERVLIFPHVPLKKLIKTGDFQHITSSAAKFYVAITRAKYSVAIVYDGNCELDLVKVWSNDLNR